MTIDLTHITSRRRQDIGFFRFKKFDTETYLITNDIGKYVYLSTPEFETFIAWDLWEGERRRELMEKGFIKTPEYADMMTPLLAHKNAFLGHGPVLHIIVATLRCNHKCRYCHAAATPMTAKNKDMSIDTARKVLDTIFHTSAPSISIEFQGGEALANWDTVRFIVEEGKIRSTHLQKPTKFLLVTNLSLMDEEKMEYLINAGVHISTSLDGDEETHNFNRIYQDGNAFERVAYWTRRIQDEYRTRGIDRRAVGAVMTVTKFTLPRAHAIVDAYIDLGLSSIFPRAMNPYGFAAAELKELGYTSEEYLTFYREVLDYVIEKNLAGISLRDEMASMYLTKILTEYDPNYLDERSPCGACIGQVTYDHDGRIYSCDEGRMLARMGIDDFRIGEVGEDGAETYRQMLQSDTTKIMVQASTIDTLPGYADDVYKPYIGVCPIHAYQTTGNIYPTYARDERRKIQTGVLDLLFARLRDPSIRTIFERWVGVESTLPESCV